MPKLDISPYPDTPEARAELVDFLTRQIPPREGPGWEQRMQHWWDENPAAVTDPERGRWVHAEGRLVAYGGSIPAISTFRERTFQTLNATTFCVDPHHPRAAAQIFLNQRELVAQRMITHSTPNPRVQEALLKLGARAEQTVIRHFFPAGIASHLSGRFWWPSLPAHLRVITDPAEIVAMARPWQRADRIEKWITPDYLRWFCRSTARQHHFLGLADGAGTLSSYLIVTPRKVRGLRSWDVLETFTAYEDDSDLLALTGLLVKEPGILPGGALLVTGAKFPSDHGWDHAPSLMQRPQRVCHFFLLPELMKHAPKHTVMAEGDLGL
ncbi:hypothetical protein [Prosthecobacter vanneervenii]|uniref:GNAT family N-acetyltransferase n=1 Tax=Prosthecobacter vanneervenii TaxID=48466 RepID=A0A7W7YG58_9BACT|nr:hypothetical protein [Prosthecobacter vanneervenii]MBB5035534.1 hypothetical protein [Prosthecobacter vanneervenii]